MYFIDSHCHMFTIADIPLYKAIEELVKDKDNLGTYIAFPLIPFIRPFYNPQKALEHYRPYISFFESEPNQVAAQLSTEAVTSVTAAGHEGRVGAVQGVILTPLIMDFDAGANVQKLEQQADRLREAISAENLGLDGNVKIFPFLGLAPDRKNIKALLTKYDVRSVVARGGIEHVPNGSFIGIKLYPPLGFDVFPEHDPAAKSRCMSFYSQLAQEGVPVTVHCQKGSFSLVDEKKKDAFTTPFNWEAVFNELSLDGQQKFRINFAHFGGDDSINDTIGFREAREDDFVLFQRLYDRTYTKTWTYSLIRLLKAYPHTYSDIAAFNFHNEESLVSLLWILYLDAKGDFDGLGGHRLLDKLLWGSDYPMILNNKVSNYGELLKVFLDSFTFTTRTVGEFQYPPFDRLPAEKCFTQAQFLSKLTYENPSKFLFG